MCKSDTFAYMYTMLQLYLLFLSEETMLFAEMSCFALTMPKSGYANHVVTFKQLK